MKIDKARATTCLEFNYSHEYHKKTANETTNEESEYENSTHHIHHLEKEEEKNAHMTTQSLIKIALHISKQMDFIHVLFFYTFLKLTTK